MRKPLSDEQRALMDEARTALLRLKQRKPLLLKPVLAWLDLLLDEQIDPKKSH